MIVQPGTAGDDYIVWRWEMGYVFAIDAGAGHDYVRLINLGSGTINGGPGFDKLVIEDGRNPGYDIVRNDSGYTIRYTTYEIFVTGIEHITIVPISGADIVIYDSPFYTDGSDTVNFNAWSEIQRGALIAFNSNTERPRYLPGAWYDARDGADVINLPNMANYIIYDDRYDFLDIVWDFGREFMAGAGDDHVTGGDHHDIINGGTGVDTLLGGAGNDTIRDDPFSLIGVGGGGGSIDGGIGTDAAHLIFSPNRIENAAGQVVWKRGDGTTFASSGEQLFAQYTDAAGAVVATIRIVNVEQITGLSTATSPAEQLFNNYANVRDLANLTAAMRASVDALQTQNQLAQMYAALDGDDIVTLPAHDALVGTTARWNSTITFNAGSGNDRITGSSGADRIDGGANHDTLLGLDGADILVGGSGDDVLDGGGGADDMSGGTGNDVYRIDNAGDAANELIDAGTDRVESSISYGLRPYFENLTLTGVLGIDGNGNSVANVIIGNGSANRMEGFAGNDILEGGEGNDILDGGVGADVLNGGPGEDEAFYGNESQGLTINLTTGVRSGAAAGDSFSSIERFTLTGFADVFVGGLGADRVSGGGGNDVLDGAGGADQMSGGLGDDQFVVDNGGDVIFEAAGEGTDTVTTSISYILAANVERLVLVGGAIAGTGNNSDNIITGNAAGNMLAGGSGNDLFNLGGGLDAVDGGSGFDTVALAGPRAEYRAFVINGTDYLLGRTDGVRLTDVEWIQFGDSDVSAATALTGKVLFEPLRYIASNPDLIRAFGPNADAGLNHFLDFGFREGRPIALFDPLRYTASHADLIRAFGPDQTRATDHYIRSGFNEGRAINFDGMLYLASHPDLIFAFGADPARATEHYVRHGFAEGRQLSFNPLLYLASNIDLSRAFGPNPTAAIDHYVRFGANEGRPTTSFDPVAYLAVNVDLIRAFGLDPAAAIQHYVRSGVHEGRATFGFDGLRYVASNADLIGPFANDPAAATRHYIRFGFNEGRSATAFDPLQYGAAHTDLARIFGTDMPALTRHYLDFGFREGRATSGFDPVAYLLSSPDLAAAGIGPAGALGHWLRNGADEMRVGDALFGREQAGHSLALGGRANDALGGSGDQDWFQIQLSAGQKVNLALGSDAFDPSLALHDSLGRRVAFDTDSGPGDDAFLAFTAGQAGLYYLVVTGTGVGTYTLDAFPGA